jgi:hypothetical protein
VIDLAPRARAGELSHESVIEQPLRQALRSRTKDDSGRRIAQLEAEVGHLVAAIGEGMMSPALRQRPQAAEAELKRLRSAPKPASVATLLPRLPALIQPASATSRDWPSASPSAPGRRCGRRSTRTS